MFSIACVYRLCAWRQTQNPLYCNVSLEQNVDFYHIANIFLSLPHVLIFSSLQPLLDGGFVSLPNNISIDKIILYLQPRFQSVRYRDDKILNKNKKKLRSNDPVCRIHSNQRIPIDVTHTIFNHNSINSTERRPSMFLHSSSSHDEHICCIFVHRPAVLCIELFFFISHFFIWADELTLLYCTERY